MITLLLSPIVRVHFQPGVFFSVFRVLVFSFLLLFSVFSFVETAKTKNQKLGTGNFELPLTKPLPDKKSALLGP